MKYAVSLMRAKEHQADRGLAGHIIITEHSSATVEVAAEALGCEAGMIAKTLLFLQGDRPVLILAEGMARVDNKKYKARFGCKARMIPGDQVEALIGHDVGGVCPFGVNEGVVIYLDESLKKHETVYPAAGTDHSAVRLTIAELEESCDSAGWVDVCEGEENETAG